jgi:hypothetical protein
MGISMADTGTGYAVGDVDVILQQTGVLVKRPGDPTWRTVPANAFTPPLTIALTSWAQDVHAVPNTGIAFISWRDDYRSLVYKTVDYGASWFSVSPLNPILYGIRYAVTFINDREGLIVGEGPGRVHRTLDGGVSWTSYSIPVNPPLTDVKFGGGLFWYVAGGDNTLFRFNTLNNRWFNISFPTSAEYFPTHIKLHFVTDERGFLSGYNQNGPTHVHRTTNGGLDWSPMPQQPNFSPNPEGHKGIFFFDSLKGWVASAASEFAYTEDGGYTWIDHTPQVFGGKPYPPVNKLTFLNEAHGWAAGGFQRTSGYPSVSHGWIMKWTGTQKPDISTTPTTATFDTMACQSEKIIRIPVINTGTGNLTIAAGGIIFSSTEFTPRNVMYPIIIAPGETKEIEVRWTPSADYFGGTPSGSQMRIESNDPEHSPWFVLLYGTRIISRVIPGAPALVFPAFCRGEEREATLPVTTDGNLPPRLERIELFSDRGTLSLRSHVIGGVIGPSDTLRFALRSDRAGSMSGKVIITAGNPDCPEVIEIPFQALVRSNDIEVTPSLLTFGDVCAGDDVVQYLQLRNTGSVDARLLEFRGFGADSLFRLDLDTSLHIGSGDFQLVPLRFHPRDSDSLNASAQFTLVFGPCPDTVFIACNGRGVHVLLDLEADSLLVVGPAPLDREIVTTVPLRNIGFLPTVIEKITFEPEVPGLRLLEPSSLPDTLRAKQTMDIRFGYRAAARDSIPTTMRVEWSDPCGGSITQPMLLITDEMPVAEVPTALIFETQTCEAEVVDSVRIHNSGQKPLAVFTATITGSDAAHFRVIGPPLPLTIDPGASAWLWLAYSAPMNGSSSAVLEINHNDLTVRGVSRVTLSGRKKVQTLTVVGDTLAVLPLCAGIPGSRRFVLRNENSEPLLLTNVDLIRGAPFATLRMGTVPTGVGPGQDFELWVDVTLPMDTSVDIEIRVVTDPCRAVYVLRFRAAVQVPLLVATPDPIDLGMRSVIDTSMVSVQLRNSDVIDVVIDSLVLRGVGAALSLVPPLAVPRMLSPGAFINADLKLRLMKDTGSVHGTLCAIVSAPCADTICFDIDAHFAGTPFVFSRDTLRYTFAFCDSVRCDSVRVVNALSGPQRVVPAVTNNAVFSVEPDTATLLEAGEGITYRLCARRPGTAVARGALLLQSDAAPLTAVELVAVRADQDLLLPDSVYAGNVPHCEDARVFPLVIENRSILDEEIHEVTGTDGTFHLLTSLPHRLRSNRADTLWLRYQPPAPGAHHTRITLRSRVGDCERETAIALGGRAAGDYIDAVPSSLLFANVVAGTAQSKSLRIHNRDMAGLRLASIAVQPSERFSVMAAMPLPIAEGSAIDLSVVFAPDSARGYFGSLCLIFDQPCADTVCIPLEGIGVEGDLVFSTPRLRFDSLASCEERIDTVLLRNTGGTAVRLLTSAIGGGGAAGYTLLSPIVPGETLAAGGTRLLSLRFRAADVPDGDATASLFITTDAPLQPVLELPISGTRLRVAIPAPVMVDLGAVLVGSATSIVADVRNEGDATWELRGITMHSDYTLRRPTLPGSVRGGDSIRVEVELLPTREGTLVDTLRVDVGPCDDVLLFIVRAVALRRFVQGDLDFGDVPLCETRSGIVTLTNNGATTVTLQSLGFTGDRAAAVRITNVPTLPHALGPGSPLILTIEFTPLAGLVGPYDLRLVSTVEIDGTTVVFQSAVTAMVRDGGLEFAARTPLGAGALGTEYPGAAVIGRNTATYTVRVEEILLPSPQLRLITATPVPPADIAPGDSMVIALAFTPDVIGTKSDSIHLRYSAPCAVTLPVHVSYDGSGDVLGLDLRAGDAAGAPDDTVDIPLLLSRDITGLNIRDWEVRLSFNASMLYPVAARGHGTLSAGMLLRHAYDQAAGVVTLTASGGRLQGPGDTLVHLRCLVLVGDDSTTLLQPEAATFGHPAVRIDTRTAGRFDLRGFCLADGTRLVGRGDGLRITAPQPNPAHEHTRIRYTVPRDGDHRLALYDTRGREVAVLASGFTAAGERQLPVDCRGLPAGSYLFVLRSGDAVTTQRLTILR